jgi:hypothetical protein
MSRAFDAISPQNPCPRGKQFAKLLIVCKQGLNTYSAFAFENRLRQNRLAACPFFYQPLPATLRANKKSNHMEKQISIRKLTVHKSSTVAFRLPSQVKDALHELAVSRGETMAQLCEKLVVRELQREGIEIVITAKLV